MRNAGGEQEEPAAEVEADVEVAELAPAQVALLPAVREELAQVEPVVPEPAELERAAGAQESAQAVQRRAARGVSASVALGLQALVQRGSALRGSA